jgi:hypothetical protein
MKRGIWIGLATGTMISGAAAIGIDTPSTPPGAALPLAQRAALEDSARQAQRATIEARYQAERAQCEALGGARRDNCLIDAHARRGRTLLEAAGPYATRG